MSCLSSHDGKVYLHVHRKGLPGCFWACMIDNKALAFEYGIAENVLMAHAFAPYEVEHVARALVQQFDGLLESIECIPCDSPNFFTPDMRKTLNLT